MSDARIWLGALFIIGYYVTIWLVGLHHLPPENVQMIKDAMLQLGPPVGVIVGALFRTSQADETRAVNTGKMADAVVAAAQAGTTPPAPGKKPDVILKPGETAQAEPAAEEAAGHDSSLSG